MLKSLIIGAALLMSVSAFADRNGNNGGRRQLVTCESKDYKYRACDAYSLSRVHNARVYQQFSKRNCVRGYNWDTTSYGVEVWDGCRATFEVTGW